MKKISVGHQKYALVDNKDFEKLSRFTWGRAGKSGHIARKQWHGRDQTPVMSNIYMSKEIMNPPQGMIVDHIDRDVLNNQRSNLRICTLGENNRNRAKNLAKCSSKYKGVHFFKRTGTWQAYINFNYIREHLGYFEDEKEAAKAYDTAAKQLFGQYAKLNFTT